MKLSDALDNQLLRLVPTQEDSDYPVPYKNEPFADWRDNLGQTMNLINVKRKFLFLKDQALKNLADKGQEIMKETLYFPNKKKAILYIGNHSVNEINFPIKGNDRLVITVTEELMNAEIANIDDTNLNTTEFRLVIDKVIGGEFNLLKTEELLGVICTPQSYRILEEKDLRLTIQAIVERVQDNNLYGDLNEIINRSTPRSRLFLYERNLGFAKPNCLHRFASASILRKAVLLRDDTQSI